MRDIMSREREFDVLIVGAGVSGSAVARELSKKRLRIAVLDKASDICEGTSKANSGIAHAGFDAKPKTLKAKLNIRGSQMMEGLAKELDFPYKRNGSLVLCFDETEIEKLEELKKRGIANGVEGLEIINKEQILEMEPSVSSKVVAALYAPTGAIICPFGLNLALAENAASNGVRFFLKTMVENIQRSHEGFEVMTSQGCFYAKVIVNAAGVYADQLHNMVSKEDDKLEITPRKGEYLLYDKKVGNIVTHTLFQLPTVLGKGVLVTPTVHGNLLTGPTAGDVEDKDDVTVTAEGITKILQKSADSMDKVPSTDVITSFAGLRAHEKEGDFVIGQVKGVLGFFDVAGIESPGLTCAPAIGEYVASMVSEYLQAAENENFFGFRKGIVSMAQMTVKEQQKLIWDNPAYANVVCRCEMITEGEILSAIHRPLGATTVDGVKRRTRAGMGRCQSGFCFPKVLEILARELSVPEDKICKNEEGSYYVLSQEGGEV